jgi:hypothetical protein
MLEGMGFNVLRQIPLEYVTGLAQGLYSLHGGVLRDHGGRIVAHLALPATSSAFSLTPGLSLIGQVVQGYQLHTLSQTVQQVLAVSLVNTALSGLGLATSLAGFVYLSRKLTRIEAQIAEIKGWLQSSDEGQLRAAISDLKHALQTSDADTKRQALGRAKSVFTALAHHFRAQAAASTHPKTASVFEDCSVTAAMGAVMATSELEGLEDAASEDFLGYRMEWKAMARDQVRALLDLENSPRLLDARYADKLPASELVRLLDFANDDPRGLRWIDDLRKGYGKATALTSGWRPLNDDCIAFASRLRAREDVLASFEEHVRFVRTRRLSVAKFAELISSTTLDGKPALIVASALRAA